MFNAEIKLLYCIVYIPFFMTPAFVLNLVGWFVLYLEETKKTGYCKPNFFAAIYLCIFVFINIFAAIYFCGLQNWAMQVQ